MRFFLPAVIKQVPKKSCSKPVNCRVTTWLRWLKKKKRGCTSSNVTFAAQFPRVCCPPLGGARSHQHVSSRRTSLDNTVTLCSCVRLWRLWGCWCPDVTFTQPERLIFWVVEGGGGGVGGGGLQIVNHYVSSSGGELVQKRRHLAEGGQRSSGFVKLTVKSVPGCFLATSWRVAFWQVLEKCWKAAQAPWM